jgi:hypothetical protein
MAESSARRSTRPKKPIIHFDDKIAQSLVPSKPKEPTKPKATQATWAAQATQATQATQDTQDTRDIQATQATERITRQRCVVCCKKEVVKKQVASLQKVAGIEVFKTDPKRPTAVSSGCGYCNVPLCKIGNCFDEWHSQKG